MLKQLGSRKRWTTVLVTSLFWIALAVYIPAIMQVIRFVSSQYYHSQAEDFVFPTPVPVPACSAPIFMHGPGVFEPATKIGNGQKNATLVIGIPTIRRESYDYLEETLTSLLINLEKQDEKDVVIVVMVTDTNQSAAELTKTQVMGSFESYINQGIIEIITPPPAFYPPVKNVSTTNDSVARLRWRTKQALDFAYLMLYSQSKGKYYIQLEDDIVTKPQYATKIKDFMATQKNYIMVEFAILGFIGKLFRTSDLSTLAQFFLMFYELKPVDYLLCNYLFVTACEGAVETEICPKRQAQLIPKYSPPLFQHIGVQSSLLGKTQELQEKDFGNITLFTANFDNPSAKKLSTTLEEYPPYSLTSLYNGSKFFWAVSPKKDDTVTIEFEKAVMISSFTFKSGNSMHPKDQFHDAVVEGAQTGPSGITTWTELGKFSRGTAKAKLDIPRPFISIRIRVTRDSPYWVVLRELSIKPIEK